MKTYIVVIILGLTLMTGAQAQQKLPMRITVEKHQESNRDTLQKARAVNTGGCRTMHYAKVTQTSQEVTLDIKLMNMTGKQAKDLTVRYYVIARDIATRNLSICGRGEQTLDFNPMETKILTTEPVSFERRDTKFVTGTVKTPNRMIGSEYHGIIVQVFQGGATPVASLYEPISLDQQLPKLQNPRAN